MSSHTVESLAQRLNATLIGSGAARIDGLCSLEEARPHYLSFWKGNSRLKFHKVLADCKAGALLVPRKHQTELGEHETAVPLLWVDDPIACVIECVPLFFAPPPRTPGISHLADIAPDAALGTDVAVGAFCSIGANSKIGDHSTLYPHVVIYPNVTIGRHVVIHAGAVIREGTIIEDDCTIHSGSVIGADGFGYHPKPGAGLVKVPQVGTVRIHSSVDVGANSCIDRATLGETVIETGTKIDNLVQIGHNVHVGKHTLLCGQVGIAGSTKIGNGVVLGGAVGVADHLHVVDGCRVAGGSSVLSSLSEKGDYFGQPAINAATWRRQLASLARLPGLLKKLRGLRSDE